MESLVEFLLAWVLTLKDISATEDIAIQEMSAIEKEFSYDIESALTAIRAINDTDSVVDIDGELLSFLEISQADLELLSQLVFGESNLEPNIGQQLVAHVVFNRANSGHWGDSIESVVYAPSQFCATKLNSWGQYNGNNIKNVLLAKYKRKFNLVEQEILDLLYFNNEAVNSRIYAAKYGLEIVQKVEGHTFYSRGKK